jgi:tRNA threonylcarbamoyl adenosine modification protein YeaZ
MLHSERMISRLLFIHFTTTPQCLIMMDPNKSEVTPISNDRLEFAPEALAEMCTKHEVKLSDFEAFGVSVGPGSYTGIKLGVTLAKTLAQVHNKPVMGLSTLELMATAYLDFDGLYIALLPARGTTFHAALFGISEGNLNRISTDFLWEHDSLLSKLMQFKERIYVIGNVPDTLNTALLANPYIRRLPLDIPNRHLYPYCLKKSPSTPSSHRTVTPYYGFAAVS